MHRFDKTYTLKIRFFYYNERKKEQKKAAVCGDEDNDIQEHDSLKNDLM